MNVLEQEKIKAMLNYIAEKLEGYLPTSCIVEIINDALKEYPIINESFLWHSGKGK